MWGFVLLVLPAAGCGDVSGDLPSGFSDRGGLDRQVVRVSLPANRSASVFAESANGSAFAIHVGEREGVRATSILRFSLADSLGNPFFTSDDTLLEANLTLTSLRKRPLTGVQTVDVWAVCSDWDESELVTTTETPPTPIEHLVCGDAPIGQMEFSGGDTTSATLAISLEQIDRWMLEPENNFGIALLPVADSSMVAISSQNAAFPPHLDIVTRTGGRSRVFSLEPEEDTYAVATTVPALSGDAVITVQNGLARRALLAFDTSSIPHGATILAAKLVLFPAASHTWAFKTGYGLEVYEAVAENWSGSYPNLDENPTPGTTVDLFDLAGLLADSLALNVQVPVQEWVNQASSNQGLLLRTTSEVGDVSYLGFYAGSAAPPDSLPRLEVHFVPAADPRFGGGSS